MPEYAFPGLNAQFTGISSDGDERYEIAPSGGMLLRDYFIAHAPAEPQPWFQPVVPAQPNAPKVPSGLTQEERNEMEGVGEFLDAEDCVQPRIREYAMAKSAHEKAAAAWRREQAKQLYVQWPLAWADAMLRARAKGGES